MLIKEAELMVDDGGRWLTREDERACLMNGDSVGPADLLLRRGGRDLISENPVSVMDTKPQSQKGAGVATPSFGGK